MTFRLKFLGTGSSGGVVSFAVTVALKDPPATLRAGMTADVTITTASATGVLSVPSVIFQTLECLLAQKPACSHNPRSSRTVIPVPGRTLARSS